LFTVLILDSEHILPLLPFLSCCARYYDETFLIIKKPKHPKRGKAKEKMEEPMSMKTKEPPNGANHKGNIKFLNPLLSREAYQIRKGEDLLKGGLSLNKVCQVYINCLQLSGSPTVLLSNFQESFYWPHHQYSLEHGALPDIEA
jgi:hypothetical protein